MFTPNSFGTTIDTVQRKKRITFYTIFVCGLLVVPAFTEVIRCLTTAIVFSVEHHPNFHVIANVLNAIYIFCFLLPLLIAYWFCYFLWLIRLWEEVPRHFARTTPEVAAGLSLVPFFNWYWMFVALGGLYRDMNRVLEACGYSRRFNTTLVFVSCFIWLAYNLLVLMYIIVGSVLMVVVPTFKLFDTTADIVGCILGGLWCLFTILIYWLIRKNVLEFMDIKSNFPPEPEV